LSIDLNLIERNWLNGASHAGAFAVAVRTLSIKLKNAAPCVNVGNAKAAVRREAVS
jgi:hypothetical protein